MACSKLCYRSVRWLLLTVGMQYLSMCVSAASQHGECRLPFCYKLFLRRIDFRFNIFSNFFDTSDPIPIEDFIRQHGYPVESHNITTHDGYELLYHRIPHGKLAQENNGEPRRTPVLVQHGLLGTSAVWVLSPTALAYSLADAGFDVWLGNARGTTYSRRHIKYDPDKDKKKFWDFSWHEMGYYDLPASIDYILNVTGHDQLSYIGHSMGTTMYFVMGATRPEYMSKITGMVAMAPVAFLWNIQSTLVRLFFDAQSVFIASLLKYSISFFRTIMEIPDKIMYVKLFGWYELFPYSPYMKWVDENLCARPQLQFICREIMNSIGGYDDKEINRTALSTVLQYVPAGASFKTFEHFKQMSKEGTNFQQFDYGFIGNYFKYGSRHPPSYNMTNIRAPTFIYYAQNDYLADPKDVQYAVDHLPNVKKVTKVPFDKFNHLDFMWAIDAKSLIYDDVISTLANFTSQKTLQDIKLDNDSTRPTPSFQEYDVFLVN